MKISDMAHGRDNNFNLIRIVAAFTVLVAHSFPLAIGWGFHNPFLARMSDMAVDSFFITSGFLITASLLVRQNTVEFLWARILRIFPALFIMLLVTVFVMGPFFTTLPLSSYFTDIRIYKYFVKNLILITGVSYELPGVFKTNPYPNAVNGALWTLPYEVWMYGLLAAVWVFFLIKPKLRLNALKLTVVSIAFLAGIVFILSHFNPFLFNQFLRLFFMFFSGSAYFILKDRIVLSRTLFSIFVVALLIASFNPYTFYAVYTVTLAYIIIYIAYIPSGFIRRYNELGDYSYGVYIYHFPVQQSIAALVPGISVVSMLTTSTIVAFLFAGFSWHLIERHALMLKGHPFDLIRKLIPFRMNLAHATSAEENSGRGKASLAEDNKQSGQELS